MIFSGRSQEGEIMQILELPQSMHPFFLATQAHPELTSRPLSPQPMFVGLVRAALRRRGIEIEIPLAGLPVPLSGFADRQTACA